MKLLTAQQTRELDQYTIDNEPISSLELMERAALGFVERVSEMVSLDTPIVIFCGLGNNGGDGLAISRLLIERNYSVETFVISYSDKCSEDFKANEKRLIQKKAPNYLTDQTALPTLPQDAVIIDALFGSGLFGPIEGLAAKYIHFINDSKLPVLAVDMPSGLFADYQNNTNVIIKAAFTFTFQYPKLSFLLPQNHEFVGTWEIIDIQLSEKFINECKTDYYYTTPEDFVSYLKPRTKHTHKGNYGHALIIGGSKGMMGAAVLASRASVLSGAGLTTVHCPKNLADIIHIAVPEALVSLDDSKNHFSVIEKIDKYSGIGVGVGLGKSQESVKGIQKLLKNAAGPLVIDADAINIIAEHKDLLKEVPKGSIFTPHPKEFERLAGRAENEYERLKLLKNFAKKYEVVCLLKGAYTAIALPNGEVHFNSTGNVGMAKGGSGDVLTGIITSLIAQNYDSITAAKLGVFIHGMAGDIAAETINLRSITASNLVEKIAEAYDRLEFEI